MHDSVKTANGTARVSVAPLGENVREYLASVVRDGVRPERDGVQVFWEAGDRWDCIRLPSGPALDLAKALVDLPLGKVAKAKEYDGLWWYPYGNRPQSVNGYVMWDGSHVFLVNNGFDAVDHIAGGVVPWWINKWLPEKMEYASEDNWETIWKERPREVGYMMTREQAGQLAALIHKRVGMSESTYMLSRYFLKRCMQAAAWLKPTKGAH